MGTSSQDEDRMLGECVDFQDVYRVMGERDTGMYIVCPKNETCSIACQAFTAISHISFKNQFFLPSARKTGQSKTCWQNKL